MPGILNPELLPLTVNPLMARKAAAQRAALLRPDVTDIFDYGPDWRSYGQNFLRHFSENFPTPGATDADSIGKLIGLTGFGIMAGPGAAARLQKPSYDPGSPQQLIPGIPPLSPEQAYAKAQRELRAAQEGMTFEDLNRGLRFEYDPDWTGAMLGSSTRQPGAWDPDYRPIADRNFSTHGKRPVRQIHGNRVFRRDLEVPYGSATPVTADPLLRGNTPQAQVGEENFQQMMARLERLRAAETEAIARGEEVKITRAREMNGLIRRNRALLAEPSINAEQQRALQEEILAAMRQRPLLLERTQSGGGGHILAPHPTGEGLLSPLEWRDLLGRSTLPPDAALSPLTDQARIVRQLRGEPPPPAPFVASARAENESAAAAMNRSAVEAFLSEARKNPRIFQYGAEPPPNVRGIEDMARHFSMESGEPIRVDIRGGASDEPMKIEIPKVHGRGELMRDRFGEIKMQPKVHERGDYPMYDEYGLIKKVEIPGPLPKGEEGPLTKQRIAEGDEPKRDSRGDVKHEIKKSEGGEPLRDERGRQKHSLEENPDYSDDPAELMLQGARGARLHVKNWDSGEVNVNAMEVGKQKGGPGALLYQTLLADASRDGYTVGASSLTEANALRLLSNTLANYARMGVNPRDLRGTKSGLAPHARDFAEGPEIWRAEAEEVKARMRARQVDPNRVRFDGNEFSVDGQVVKPDEIADKAGWRPGELNIGSKTIMRMAFFDWLRAAPVERAKDAARNWGRLGPLLGIAPMSAGVLAPFMRPEQSD